MIEGDRFLLVGSHAQGLKSMWRGRGESAVTAAASARTASKTKWRDIAARAAAATDSAGLRERHHPASWCPVELPAAHPACSPTESMQISSLLICVILTTVS